MVFQACDILISPSLLGLGGISNGGTARRAGCGAPSAERQPGNESARFTLAQSLLENQGMTARFRSLRIAVLSLSLASAAAGCDLEDGPPGMGGGGEGGAGGGTDSTPSRIPSGDSAYEQMLDDLGIICESTLTVTGSFTEGAAQPSDLNGCWPVGTWRIEAAIDRQGCDPQTPIDGEFVYEVTHEEDTDDVTFVTDPSDERVNLKINTDGTGLCLGAFEHYGLANDVITFRPVLQEDGSITGIGSYQVHTQDPF
jgi:hypothetical protein